MICRHQAAGGTHAQLSQPQLIDLKQHHGTEHQVRFGTCTSKEGAASLVEHDIQHTIILQRRRGGRNQVVQCRDLVALVLLVGGDALRVGEPARGGHADGQVLHQVAVTCTEVRRQADARSRGT